MDPHLTICLPACLLLLTNAVDTADATTEKNIMFLLFNFIKMFCRPDVGVGPTHSTAVYTISYGAKKFVCMNPCCNCRV